MMNLYRARCDRCEYDGGVFPEEYAALIADGLPPRESSIERFGGSPTYLAAVEPDPRLVAYEDGTLGEDDPDVLGHARAGRYVRVRRRACRSCGRFYDHRRLDVPPTLGHRTGTIIGLLAGIGVFAWVSVDRGPWDAWFCSIATFGGVFLVTWLAVHAIGRGYTRHRFALRAREIDGPDGCPACGSRETVGSACRDPIPCPACGERALRIHHAGVQVTMS